MPKLGLKLGLEISFINYLNIFFHSYFHDLQMYHLTPLPNQYQISDLVVIYHEINLKLMVSFRDAAILYKTYNSITI